MAAKLAICRSRSSQCSRPTRQACGRAGLTIDTPTGDGAVAIDNSIANPLTVAFSNDASPLSPFIGFLCAPSNGNTHQGFVQIDVATNANTLTFSDVSGQNTEELLEAKRCFTWTILFSKQLYNAGRSARSVVYTPRTRIG